MQGVMNVRFSTLEDAKKAAEAYAKANRGTEFTVVEFKGTVVADGVTWK
jgi:hypothetical protein